MKPKNIDEQERTATYNLSELQRVRERGDGESELAQLFEHRMNQALETLGLYFQVASGVVAEITDES